MAEWFYLVDVVVVVGTMSNGIIYTNCIKEGYETEQQPQHLKSSTLIIIEFYCCENCEIKN